MGMTIAEKVLAAHSGKNKVESGEYVWCNVDGTAILGHGLLLMGHDISSNRLWDSKIFHLRGERPTQAMKISFKAITQVCFKF